jgi:hypothetical protein
LKGWRTSLGEATFVVGIDNLLDSDPPFTRRYPNGYDPTSGDPRGRFFLRRVSLARTLTRLKSADWRRGPLG